MFRNQSIQSNITAFNGNSFGRLNGFGMYSSSGIVYHYEMDWYKGVFILNDQWSFISFKVFTYPLYMISTGNSLFMTGRDNVWKLDQDLNILINYEPNGSDPHYRGISYK